MNDLRTSSHRRWNPLQRQWVLVSPHRTMRPWQGQVEDAAPASAPAYDPACYLCPGNERANGGRTPLYESVYVFQNDFAALQQNTPDGSIDDGGLLRAEAERGICRVLCFDPRHDLTLATMDTQQISRVVLEWVRQERELGLLPWVNYVQIFENRGAMMGASNPHPHGQIWATEHIPNEPLEELHAQREYFSRHHRPLLMDYLEKELAAKERIVLANDRWIAIVPFWAVWPFETMILPTKPVSTFSDLDTHQQTALAEILQQLTAGYNRVFNTPFPYSMGFHPAPCDGESHPEWTLHAHFYPPLLRSATVRKFMVGFELLGSPQRDITPEAAAVTLRNAMTAEAKIELAI